MNILRRITDDLIYINPLLLEARYKLQRSRLQSSFISLLTCKARSGTLEKRKR